MTTLPWSRNIVRIVTALGLGAITTAVVAGGCTWFQRGVSVTAREATRYPEPSDCGMKVKRFDSATGFDIQVQTGAILETTPSPNSAPGDVDLLVPEWARAPLVPWGWRGGWQIGQWSCRRLAARGWPMAAMWSTVEATVATHSGFGSWRAVEGRSFDGPPPPGVFSATLPRVVPVRLIAAGFAVDTAVYAVAWWGVMAIVSVLRRAVRRRRGRCARCGYDLRATDGGRPCPECGADR